MVSRGQSWFVQYTMSLSVYVEKGLKASSSVTLNLAFIISTLYIVRHVCIHRVLHDPSF